MIEYDYSCVKDPPVLMGNTKLNIGQALIKWFSKPLLIFNYDYLLNERIGGYVILRLFYCALPAFLYSITTFQE